jgi:hypothetical protein
MPELLRHGRTGFLVADVPAAVSAVAQVSQLDRRECHQDAITRFSSGRMVRDHLAVFERVVQAAG